MRRRNRSREPWVAKRVQCKVNIEKDTEWRESWEKCERQQPLEKNGRITEWEKRAATCLSTRTLFLLMLNTNRKDFVIRAGGMCVPSSYTGRDEKRGGDCKL